MRPLKLRLGDRLVLLDPVPASKIVAFEALLQDVFKSWRDEFKGHTEQFIDRRMGSLQQILDLLPRADCIVPLYGFDISLLDTEQIKSLFLFQLSESGEYAPSQLVELHQPHYPIELPPPEPVEGEDIGNWVPPIPSCGDFQIDQMAMLALSFGVEGALKLYDTFDRERINLWIERHNECQRDPEDRRQEYMRQWFEEVKAQNRSDLNELLGL